MSGFSGVRGLTFLIPEHNLGVAILSNFGALRVSLMPEALRSTFLDLYLDLPKHDWDQEITQTMTNIRDENKQFMAKERQQDPRPCKDLKAYEGEFENEQYGKIKITLKNDKLWLTYRSREILLNHWNGDEFSFAGNDLALAYSGFRNEFNRPVDLTQGAMPETYRLMDPLVVAKGKLSLGVKKKQDQHIVQQPPPFAQFLPAG
eukprot:gene11185-11266_t